jgi:N-terminal acetyltransferase B complex non-catalytic subunit
MVHWLTTCQLTEDELALFRYMTELTDWLDPVHNFLRPKTETVKQKVKNNVSSNGRESSNGHGKKPEDTPPVTEPPESILEYFKSRWLQIL